MLNVFIGYDSRQHEAFLACRQSLGKFARKSGKVNVWWVNHRELRAEGLFTRPWRIDEKGQYWDTLDGKPFSTEFAYTRFLVPAMAKKRGLKGPVLFCDSDFLFRSDPYSLLSVAHPAHAVSVVQHQWQKPVKLTKMDGMKQDPYRRKLWSSLMLFNLDHPSCAVLDDLFVNSVPGGTLHQFDWLDDSEIGEIMPTWNWVPGHSDPKITNPDAVHWSFGGPWMKGYEHEPFALEWWNSYIDALKQGAERVAEEVAVDYIGG